MESSLEVIEQGMDDAKAWASASGDRAAGRTSADTWLVSLVHYLLDNPGADRERVEALLTVYNSF